MKLKQKNIIKTKIIGKQMQGTAAWSKKSILENKKMFKKSKEIRRMLRKSKKHTENNKKTKETASRFWEILLETGKISGNFDIYLVRFFI